MHDDQFGSTQNLHVSNDGIYPDNLTAKQVYPKLGQSFIASH